METSQGSSMQLTMCASNHAGEKTEKNRIELNGKYNWGSYLWKADIEEKKEGNIRGKVIRSYISGKYNWGYLSIKNTNCMPVPILAGSLSQLMEEQPS